MGLSFAHATGGKGNGNGCRSVCKSGKNLNFVDKNEDVFFDNRVGKIQETKKKGDYSLLPYGCPAKMASIIEFSRFVPVKKNKKLRRN
jgi:hypothetical protein